MKKISLDTLVKITTIVGMSTITLAILFYLVAMPTRNKMHSIVLNKRIACDECYNELIIKSGKERIRIEGDFENGKISKEQVQLLFKKNDEEFNNNGCDKTCTGRVLGLTSLEMEIRHVDMENRKRRYQIDLRNQDIEQINAYNALLDEQDKLKNEIDRLKSTP